MNACDAFTDQVPRQRAVELREGALEVRVLRALKWLYQSRRRSERTGLQTSVSPGHCEVCGVAVAKSCRRCALHGRRPRGGASLAERAGLGNRRSSIAKSQSLPAQAVGARGRFEVSGLEISEAEARIGRAAL